MKGKLLYSPIDMNAAFNKLLRAKDWHESRVSYWVTKAEFSNICRKKGVQGSTIDFLICAVATVENFIIFTTDKDFENYKKYLPNQEYQLLILFLALHEISFSFMKMLPPPATSASEVKSFPFAPCGHV